jgi:hypothetical protein
MGMKTTPKSSTTAQTNPEPGEPPRQDASAPDHDRRRIDQGDRAKHREEQGRREPDLRQEPGARQPTRLRTGTKRLRDDSGYYRRASRRPRSLSGGV